jgi:D-amino-acid dehydrogenase
LGAQFHHGQTIEGIAVETGKVIGVDADFERRAVGGAYVRALGSYGPKVLRPIGINLPICPAKGCSAALPVMDDAPRSSIIDETHEVAMILDGTPDGTPVTGPSAYRNLFRTTVHGTPSWTVACR